MESILEIPSKKPKLKQNLNLRVAECIRQFELPQQYPSTINKFCLSNSKLEESNEMMQTKNMQNIISALPLSGKIKFIPNKEVSLSENFQKLKLKLPNGRDLGEVKIILPIKNKNLQTKVNNEMTKIGLNSRKFLKSQTSRENKTININGSIKISKISSSIEKQLEKLENTASNMKLQIKNSNHNILSTAQNNNFILINLKKFPNIKKHKIINQQNLVQNRNSDIKKFIIKNSNICDQQISESQLNVLKKSSKSKKLVMIQNDNKVLKFIPDKLLSFKPYSNQKFLHNHNLKQNYEKIILKNSSSDLTIKNNNNFFIKHINNFKGEKNYLKIYSKDLKMNTDLNTELLDINNIKTIKLEKSVKRVMNRLPKKNIMVIVPTQSSEELTTINNLERKNVQIVQKNKDKIMFITDDKLKAILHQSNDDLSNVRDTFINKQKICKANNITEILNNKNTMSQDIIDKLSILKKVLLKIQDDSLRTKALSAVKKFGSKIKTSIPIKCSKTTKKVKDFQTQTEIFSLLRNEEFSQITSDLKDIKIKQSRKLIKLPISTLFSNILINRVYSNRNESDFKDNFNIMVEKVFPKNKKYFDIKKTFIQNKIFQAKTILKQVLLDFKATKNFDKNGLLSIHRAVINDDIQEVQKCIIMLKAAKQSIDICSLDNKTSLELSVEYEVNPQIIKILLNAGAQPVLLKSIHDSAIILAAKKSSKILSLLLKYINHSNFLLLNAKNSEGLAAIHYCAQHGNLEGIIELLKHGAEVNLQDERSGRTALFYAIETKNNTIPQEIYNEIAHKLLENGAISNIPIFSKHSVLSLIDDVKSHTLKIALNKAVK